ncbi:hypothetical protein Lal_00035340 [Lupinus albus]|nr:hypothetical protein Lal_00035340 [Lupinus albus]
MALGHLLKQYKEKTLFPSLLAVAFKGGCLKVLQAFLALARVMGPLRPILNIQVDGHWWVAITSYDGFTNKITFIHKGQKVVLSPLSPKQCETSKQETIPSNSLKKENNQTDNHPPKVVINLKSEKLMQQLSVIDYCKWVIDYPTILLMTTLGGLLFAEVFNFGFGIVNCLRAKAECGRGYEMEFHDGLNQPKPCWNLTWPCRNLTWPGRRICRTIPCLEESSYNTAKTSKAISTCSSSNSNEEFNGLPYFPPWPKWNETHPLCLARLNFNPYGQINI